jgi:hypothetical protein
MLQVHEVGIGENRQTLPISYFSGYYPYPAHFLWVNKSIAHTLPNSMVMDLDGECGYPMIGLNRTTKEVFQILQSANKTQP